MKFLTIRFVDEPDLISKLITWTTGGSLWCHTEGLNRTEDKWVGAHSGTGIEARALDWCKPVRERQYKIPVTEGEYELAMAFMESKIGTPYDYTDIAGLFLHDRSLNQNSREICSAFMLDWLWAGEQYALNCLPGFSYLITPETLHLSSLLIGRCSYSFP